MKNVKSDIGNIAHLVKIEYQQEVDCLSFDLDKGHKHDTGAGGGGWVKARVFCELGTIGSRDEVPGNEKGSPHTC